MNGIKYLLDTNIIIGVLKGNEQAVSLTRGMNLSTCAFSAITRMELLGFPDITEHEYQAISALLSGMTRLTLTTAIEDETIRLRRKRRLKLPDAVIVSTAATYNLQLITLDKQLITDRKTT
jgi:predicted nucleic acid-binding protein